MARKIKDAKDLTTNELIYFKGHAKATYMSDGRTVEDAINNIGIGGGNSSSSGGGLIWQEISGNSINLTSGVRLNLITYSSGNISISNNELKIGESAALIFKYSAGIPVSFQSGYAWVWANDTTPTFTDGWIYELDFLRTPSGVLVTFAEYIVLTD